MFHSTPLLSLSADKQALIRERFEASKDEIDEDSQPIDPSELVRKEWSIPMEPPETLVLPILPYQKEGLGWMHNQVRILGNVLVSDECLDIDRF